jgi:hypothetical protein
VTSIVGRSFFHAATLTWLQAWGVNMVSRKAFSDWSSNFLFARACRGGKLYNPLLFLIVEAVTPTRGIKMGRIFT